MFDKDGGGTISVPEIRLIMDQRGDRISDKELTELMNAIDEDRSGEIDFSTLIFSFYLSALTLSSPLPLSFSPLFVSFYIYIF